jgi:hypothetical protein
MAAAAAVAACELTTEPVVFQDFQWLAVGNANSVTDGIDAAALAGDIALLGQMRTPTLCFKLTADFTRDEPTLTVRVKAEQSNSPNCSTAPGGYQYTAAIRGLSSGDYTVRVIHSIAGSADKEYTKSVRVR